MTFFLLIAVRRKKYMYSRGHNVIKENSKTQTHPHMDTYKIIIMLPIKKKNFHVFTVPEGLGLKYTK